MDRTQERGPRQVAGGPDTFLAEVCVPRMLLRRFGGLKHLGVKDSFLAHLLRLPLGGPVLLGCLKYLFSKGLTSR